MFIIDNLTWIKNKLNVLAQGNICMLQKVFFFLFISKEFTGTVNIAMAVLGCRQCKLRLCAGSKLYILLVVIFYMVLVLIIHSNVQSDDMLHTYRHIKSDRRLVEHETDDSKLMQRPNIQSQMAFNGPNSDVRRESKTIKHITTIPSLTNSERIKNDNVETLEKRKARSNTQRILKKTKLSCDNKGAEASSFTEILPNLFVYSVFWDSRKNDFDNVNSRVFLRIMAMMSDSLGRDKPKLYCIFDNPFVNSNGTYSSSVTYYKMIEAHGLPDAAFILSCPVPEELYDQQNKDSAICSVRISYSKTDGTYFTIVNTSSASVKHNFSMCVPPLYGPINKVRLVEFLEMSFILGANHVTFYDFNITQDTLTLLEYYENLALVTIIPWNLPSKLESWYHGQMLSIQDCLYRNMGKTKYLLMSDIDEFLIPYQHKSWHDMVMNLSSTAPNLCGFKFNSAFFDPYYQVQSNDSQSAKLVTFVSRTRTVQTCPFRAKYLVQPELIFEAGIHHISKPVFGHLQTANVDLPLALLHHYRACQNLFQMKCARVQQSSAIETRYGSLLIKNVFATLDKYSKGIYKGG